MRNALFALLVLAVPSGTQAQLTPSPSLEDPRIQTLIYDASRPARLVAFADANLTVMLLAGDQIEQVTTSDRGAFEIEITDANDSLNIAALRPNASATLVVTTRQRRYEFDLGTKGGLAAYLVRVVANRPAPSSPTMPMPPSMLRPPSMPPGLPLSAAPTEVHRYKVSGERSLFPIEMSDDGERTYIQWSKHQSLPAVFAVGPKGQEAIVDGYMRNGKFTIDRVYTRLVFRIDKLRAKATRRSKDK